MAKQTGNYDYEVDLRKKLENAKTEQQEMMIPVNGMLQIVEMLRVADPKFRDTILRGLMKRDPALVQELLRRI